MSDMIPYVVHTGDHLVGIANRLGFDADTIWNHPENVDLKTRRKNGNILFAGDVLYVPKPRPRKWHPVTVGAINRFAVRPATVTFSTTFSQDGEPLAHRRCVVHGLPPPREFATDAGGKLRLTVRIDVRELVVEFPTVPLVRRLRIGHLDPITEPIGAFQRLRNLGYLSARTPFTGDGATTAGALGAFQRDRGLPPTGKLDAVTRDALEQEHGC